MPIENDFWDMSQVSPGMRGEAVTPADSVDLTNKARGFYVGGAGNVKVTMFGGTDITFVGMLGGVHYPYAITKVFSTGTTASNIIAMR